MRSEPTTERRVSVSTELAGRPASRFALAGMMVSVAAFFAAVPFATFQLPHVPAFIPAYESAVVICGFVTAVLLFTQFNFLRARALLVLASGYLFSTLFAFAHALTFPEVFSPTGLLGAGPQSTVWLYMFWHGGFPLFIVAYALLKDEPREVLEASWTSGMRPGGAARAILASVSAVLAGVSALTLVATAHEGLLPVLILNDRFTPAMAAVVTGIWMLSVFVLGVLWRRRPHKVLDLWLMVVMCAWLADVALSAVLNAGTFDLGWYAGRIYGLVAAGLLLVVLLIENGTHYARLAQSSAELSGKNESLERLSLQDGLTDLANRRFFDVYLTDQISIARRHKRTLALVLCDIDFFKAFNDHYGHLAGDSCLKEVAAALRSCCRRPSDMAARYGGEEFALILPDTERVGAIRVGEAARDAVERLGISHAHSDGAPHVSISGGVAVLLRGAVMSPQELIAAADQALYEAKRLGRNQMVSQAEPE